MAHSPGLLCWFRAAIPVLSHSGYASAMKAGLAFVVASITYKLVYIFGRAFAWILLICSDRSDPEFSYASYDVALCK